MHLQELIDSMEGRLIVQENPNYQLKEKESTHTRYPGHLYHGKQKKPAFPAAVSQRAWPLGDQFEPWARPRPQQGPGSSPSRRPSSC